MRNLENIPVEQLWYTWSDVGLSSVHAGFRIRAASPGLMEIYSERVKSMDRYIRYALPPGTSRATITPEIAPTGLAFVRTEWNNEYILVHKNYLGEDGVGRSGNFFVHVLALGESSASFSAEDAIWLWNADLWRKNDQEQDRRSNELPLLPPTALDSNPRFHPQFAQVQHALPFVIEAYLTRKERVPLYIAAPAHQTDSIAYLIAGLTNCLPEQLRAGLTFSTYEPDITKASTEIVGTSWIATPGNNDASQVMPAQWYSEHLAINCTTKEQSRLQGHAQISYNPLAAHFAAYATRCLISNNMKQLYALCALAERSQALTVDLFLQLYNDEIANTDSIRETEIERYLTHPDLYLNRLSSQTFRKKIIERVLENPQWGETRLTPILSKLCIQAQREHAASSPGGHPFPAPLIEEQELLSATSLQEPQKRSQKARANAQTNKPRLTLAEALALLAKRATPEIVNVMKQVSRAGQRDESSAEKLKAAQIITLLYMTNSCLLPQDPYEVWIRQFEEISQSRSATNYLKAQWRVRFLFLQAWNKALPVDTNYDKAVRPLVIVPWDRLGKFLKVIQAGRHKQWSLFALEKLLPDSSLTPQVAQELEQSYAKEIHDLLLQLMQEESLPAASSLINILIEKGYRIKPPLDALIDRLLTSLLSNKRLSSARELVTTLTGANYIGTASYQKIVETLLSNLFITEPAMGNELLDLLIAHKYPGKKALLDILLATNRGQTKLQNIITHVYRTPEELNAFFLNDGPHYLANPAQIPAMTSLYQILLQHFPQSGKLERLFVLLNVPLDEKTILQLLSITPLEGYEPATILEQCGKDYLEAYRLAPDLAGKVVEWFGLLTQMHYPDGRALLFKLLTPATDYQYIEQLLKIAALTPAEQILFLERGGESYLSSYLQLPSLMEYINTYVAAFKPNSLDRPETKRILTVLTQQFQHLHLDENTLHHIQWWKTIDDYCTQPALQPDALRSLVRALWGLGLPNNNAQFTEKLAHAFVSCINTSNDLSMIMELMQQTKVKDSSLRFLYALAEQAAAYTQERHESKVLLPYLLFALMWNGQEVTPHFLQVFLDTLLSSVDVSTVTAWHTLNDWLMMQNLSAEALDRWEFYLEKLNLLSQLRGDTSGSAQTRIGSKSLSTEQAGSKYNSVESVSPASHPEYNSSTQQQNTRTNSPSLWRQPRHIDIGPSARRKSFDTDPDDTRGI